MDMQIDKVPHDPSHTFSYPLAPPEGAAEMQWFALQDTMLTAVCLPLLTPEVFNSPTHILDLACGSGIWAMQVAKTYPQMQVTGIDNSLSVIEYVQMVAKAEDIANVSFQLADYRHLDQVFPPAQFDLVNARLTLWSQGAARNALVQHWGSMVKPGGILRLTDWEVSTTNSPSFNLLTQYLTQALYTRKRSDSPYRIGIVYHLAPLLRQAGFSQLITIPHYVDFNAGAPFHASYIQDIVQGAMVMEPFIVGSGVVEQETYRACLRQTIKEIDHPAFLGGHFFLSIWGVKGETTPEEHARSA